VAYDEELAERVRRVLGSRTDVEEKNMFGGLAFMVRGHMACGLVGDTLMVRVSAADYGSLIDQPHVRPMDFTGRVMKGFLYVEPDGLAMPQQLRTWVNRSTAFADTLPDKPHVAKRAKRSMR
jgi:TfoX/Sxy family transcriptional regulator of competence genes